MIIYSFRTFPWITELPSNTIIFGKLNEDFEKFREIVLHDKPDLILGLAKADKTRVETQAINRFNKSKKIIAGGPESYDLYLPNFAEDLNLASKPADSFCNWTMYKIANLIEEEKLETRLSFIHLCDKDFKFLEYL